MTTTSRVCTGTAASEARLVDRDRRRTLDRMIPRLLAERPMTTRELSQAIGTLPALRYYVGGDECPADDPWACGGHGAFLMNGYVMTDEIRRVLVHLERKGQASRVVLAGAQAHLWSLR